MEQSNRSDDEDELTKLAQQPGQGKVINNTPPSYLNDTEKFIRAFHMCHGRFKIRATLLYRLYRRWSKKPVTKHSFYFTFSLYFLPQRTKQNQSYYLVDQGFWHLNRKYEEMNRNEEERIAAQQS